MMNARLSALLAMFLALSAALCVAQETQIPIDERGKLNVIDKKTEAKLGLFPEYEGFQSARLFQSSDTSFVLEITYQPADKVQRVSLPMTAEEVRLLRARVTETVRTKAPDIALDQSGRTAFLLGTAALSLGYYGWVLPWVLDIDTAEGAVGTYMLTSGAGFFGPFFLTRHRSVTDGMATMSLYGGSRGIIHGIFVGRLIKGEDLDFDGWATASMFTSLGEYAAGFIVADQLNMSAGTAEAIGVIGDLGYGIGLGTAYLSEIDNDRGEAAILLLATGGGLFGGHMLAQKQHYTRGDAYVLRAVTHLLSYDCLSAAEIIATDSKADVGGTMAGGLAGAILGHYLVRGKDFTTGQGVLVHVGEFTGALVGLGVAFVAQAGDHEIYMASGALGATAGFWVTYHSLAGSARTHDGSSSWDLELCPQGLLASAKRPLPLVKLHYRF